MNNPINTPTEAGIYWARTSRCQWWNLIVNVIGDAPFLSVDSLWKWSDMTLITDPRSLLDIKEFGPKLEIPPPPILTKEEKIV